MFPSSGYFKSILCPYYENGFCERPHCHFKHDSKKKDDDKTDEENPTDLLRLVNEAVKKMEKEVQLGAINSIDDDETVDNKKETKKSKPSSSKVLEYKPTPIAELKKMQQENKYANAMIEETDEMEYDPLTNYSAGLASKNTKPVTKSNSIPYVPSKRSVLAKIKEDKASNKKIKLEEETESETEVVQNDKFDIVNQILVQSEICEKAISNQKNEKQSKKSGKNDLKKSQSKKSPQKESKHSKSESKKKSKVSEKKLKVSEKTSKIKKMKNSTCSKSSKNVKNDVEKVKVETKELIDCQVKSEVEQVKVECKEEKKVLSDFESTDDEKAASVGGEVGGNSPEFSCSLVSDSDLDEHDTEEECRRIFEEFVPDVQTNSNGQFKAVKRELSEEEINPSHKKRVAHEGCIDNRTAMKRTARVNASSALPKTSPAQAMLNRYAQLKKMREDESNLVTPTLISSNSAFLSTVTTSIGKKRIAHVPNVSALMTPVVQKTKLNVHHSAVNTTVAQTAKGSSRVAHMPSQMSARPMITPEYGSRVPTNVRQRYLNSIIDECVKLYPDEQDAYTRALSEEKNAYSRSSNRSVYLNVVVNTIHRLRSEVSGVLPQQSLPSASTAPAPVVKSAPIVKRTPQNSISHEFVLGGKKAANVSYSIERRRSSVSEEISPTLLFEMLQPYISTRQQLEDNGYPTAHPTDPGKAIILKQDPKKKCQDPTGVERACCRCGARFKVSSKGVYLTREECVYHWGRAYKRRVCGTLDNRYNCCQGDLQAEGCCVSQVHVSDNIQYDNLRGYVTTLPKSPPADDNYGIYALDCEMSYTNQGCELTRVTVIDAQLKSVYETFVKPDNPIIDYNSRFSGITEEDMRGVTTTLRDVQAVLLNKFNSKTILIGHSLESDFQALKLIHQTVVDTAVVFPHRLGPPYKRALRNLMAEFLNKIIQNDVNGHDSKEDAVACMELMMWKVREDLKKKRF